MRGEVEEMTLRPEPGTTPTRQQVPFSPPLHCHKPSFLFLPLTLTIVHVFPSSHVWRSLTLP